MSAVEARKFTESEKKDEKPAFYKFTLAFQENLVKLILSDRAFASQMQEVLELNYFQESIHQTIVDQVFKYKDRFGCQPAFDTIDILLTHELPTDMDNIKIQKIQSFWNSFKNNPVINDAEYHMKTSLDFCRAKKIVQAMRLHEQMLKESNIDGFMEALNKAASLGSSNNFGHDYKEDFEKRYEKDYREPITLGFPELDAKSGGGIGRGEVFVYVAPQSQGKTSRMIYTAVQNLKAGRNVVFFTLEMKEAVIGQLFDICLTAMDREELLSNIDSAKVKIKHTLDSLPGKLKIIQEEYGVSTPRRMFNKIRKLEENGFAVDLICIDYMDICAPTKTINNDDGMVGGVQVYSELKTLTERYNLRVLTAAQTNRDGSETEIITQKHFEGMFKRFNPCHLVVGFSRFSKVSCLKTRVGAQFLFNESRDFKRLQFDVFEPEGDFGIDENARPQTMSDALESFLRKKGSKKK